MTELSVTRLWSKRLLFAGLSGSLIFLHLLPLQTRAESGVWPDIMLGIAIAWSVRRPDYVPLLLLTGVFLLADLLLQRPPGLWAALVLVVCTRLQKQSRDLRDATFVTEFLTVSAWIVALSVVYRSFLALFLVDLPPIGPVIYQTLLTIAFYPIVVLFTHWVIGVRKQAPGDFERTGAGS